MKFQAIIGTAFVAIQFALALAATGFDIEHAGNYVSVGTNSTYATVVWHDSGNGEPGAALDFSWQSGE